MPPTSWSSVSVRAERSRPLGEHLERTPAALGGRVVADDEAQRSRHVRGGGDLEARGRTAPNRLLEGLAHDLVKRGLRPLAERVDHPDVERDLDSVLSAAGLCERIDRGREAVVA